jgi:ribosome-binding factor A
MGDEKAQSLCMHGLRSARGFIQAKIAERLELRYTPILHFFLDPGVKLSVEASSVIRQALGEDGLRSASEDHDGPAGEMLSTPREAGIEDDELESDCVESD